MSADQEQGSEVLSNQTTSSQSRQSDNSLDPSQYDNIIEIYGSSKGSCGYCLGEEREVYDIKAIKMTADVYQEMIDLNWRRSGHIMYRPYNDCTCCPNYCISCNTTKFELSRSQARCITKMNSFLISGETKRKLRLSHHLNDSSVNNMTEQSQWKHDVEYVRDNFERLKKSSKARDRRFVASCERIMRLHGVDLESSIRTIRNKPRNSRCGPQITLEDQLFPRKTDLKTGFLQSLEPKHRLEVRLLHVDSEESHEIRAKEHEVIVDYQKSIHKEEPEEWTMERFKNFLIDTPLKAELIRDRDYCPQEDADDESVSRKMNLSVDVLPDESEDFLLVKPPPLPTHFGTYHCVYLLDGELIAVGVIDFLPKCLTTVYFFYNPKYTDLNLGTYSALVEISIVRHMFKHYRGPPDKNELKHYYIGFYVHPCKKMHYKTTFKPSYLLCPITSHFVPVEICLPILEEKKYARFDNKNEPPQYKFSIETVLQIPVSAPVLRNSTKLIEYWNWLRSNTSEDYVLLLTHNFILRYVWLVKPNLVRRIMIRLDPLHRAFVNRHSRGTQSGF